MSAPQAAEGAQGAAAARAPARVGPRQVLEGVAELMRGADRRHRARARASYLATRARTEPTWRALARAGRPVVALGLVEHLGDLVAAEPVLRRARVEHPDAFLVWCVRRDLRPLVAAHPGVDLALPLACVTEWDHWRRRGPFAAVLELHVAGKGCARCSQALARLDGRTDVSLTDYYEHGCLRDIYASLSGLGGPFDTPRLHVDAASARRVDALSLPPRFVALHGWANQPERGLPPAARSRLAGRLHVATGLPVVEVGPAPRPDRDVAGHVDLGGRLSPTTLAEVLRRAALFVGVDSGPAHVAQAVGTEAVLLLGRYGRYTEHMPFCDGYADGTDATVLRAAGPAGELDPDAVAAAARARLAGEATRSGCGADAPFATPGVSVVVPTYGHAELLLETLASVLDQDEPPDEVLVVDDGSPDDTAARLAAWPLAHRVRYVRQANAGVAAARNHGLRLARGRFVAFLDDDDLWPADKLARQAEVLRADPAAVLAYGRYAALGPDGVARPDRTRDFPAGDVTSALLRGNRIHSLGQTLVRRDALLDVGGFDERLGASDDWDLYIRLSRRGTFRFDDRLALRYRLHGANTSRQALRHARDHARVATKHLGRDLRAHWLLRRRAARYFVPHLVEEAARSWRAGRRGHALRAGLRAWRYDLTLPVRPALLRRVARAALSGRSLLAERRLQG